MARVFILDSSGETVERTKEFGKRKDADDFVREEADKFKRSGGREIDAETMTFNDLADYYEEHYARSAEYIGERKIGGLRSLKPIQGYVRTLRGRFGQRRLNTLTHGEMRGFRDDRLKTPVVKKIKVKVPLTDEQRILRPRKRFTYEYREREYQGNRLR